MGLAVFVTHLYLTVLSSELTSEFLYCTDCTTKRDGEQYSDYSLSPVSIIPQNDLTLLETFPDHNDSLITRPSEP